MRIKRCYDCGSSVPKHHTKHCELAEKDAIRDLPQVPATQWWNRLAPQPSKAATLAAKKDIALGPRAE